MHAPQTAVSLNAWFCLQLLNIRYPFPPSTIFCLHVGGVTQPGAGEGIILQGVPYYWARFVFVIFSGSRAHTEELFIAIG